jgi:hypothetical protein
MQTLDDLRADFDTRSKQSLSMPIGGLIVWSLVAVLGAFLPLKTGVLALVFATGAIFPIAMVIAKYRGEQLVDNPNPLAKLMGTCVAMVNLLWAVHIPLVVYAPEFVPLSLGVGLGLHWMVYSWIIAHPLGYHHAVLRTIGLLAVWFAFPAHLVTASALVVVAAYAMTLFQMNSRSAIAHALAASRTT